MRGLRLICDFIEKTLKILIIFSEKCKINRKKKKFCTWINLCTSHCVLLLIPSLSKFFSLSSLFCKFQFLIYAFSNSIMHGREKKEIIINLNVFFCSFYLRSFETKCLTKLNFDRFWEVFKR